MMFNPKNKKIEEEDEIKAPTGVTRQFINKLFPYCNIGLFSIKISNHQQISLNFLFNFRLFHSLEISFQGAIVSLLLYYF